MNLRHKYITHMCPFRIIYVNVRNLDMCIINIDVLMYAISGKTGRYLIFAP